MAKESAAQYKQHFQSVSLFQRTISTHEIRHFFDTL